MKYDFTTLPDRRGKGAVKWIDMEKAKPDVGKDVVPLSIADMEFENPPEIMRGLKDFLKDSILGYTAPTDAYFEAVIAWMRRRKNWHIKREMIVCSPGVIPTLYASVRAFTEPGDGVLLMTPAYPPFYNAVTLNNRRVVSSPLIYSDNRYQIDFEDLEIKSRAENVKLLILCNPHNPTGRCWSEEELRRLGEICLANHLVLISDEIHSDLIMPGNKHFVFNTVNPAFAQISLVCTAPSKTFNLAGMQTSNIIIENLQLRRRFKRELTVSMGGTLLNIMGYEACRIAYTECEQWLEELIQVIWENHQLVKEMIAERLPRVKVLSVEGTYLQWLDFTDYGLDAKQMEALHVKKAEIFLDEGYIFGPEGEGFERVNLACPKWVLEREIGRLCQAYENL